MISEESDTMTLEEKENTPPESDMGGFQLIDFNIPQREKPMVHPAVDPPLCQQCQQMELTFFDPNCPNCQEILMNQNTSVPQIFAILRQWTPQTQQSLELLIREVGMLVKTHQGVNRESLRNIYCSVCTVEPPSEKKAFAQTQCQYFPRMQNVFVIFISEIHFPQFMIMMNIDQMSYTFGYDMNNT